MQATRRFWATAALGISFVILAVLTDRLLPLVGAVGLGAWLVATAWAAGRAFRSVEDLEIDYRLPTPSAQVGSTVHATLNVSRPAVTADCSLRVSATAPPGLRSAADTASTFVLEPEETEGSTSVPLDVRVAGRFSLPTPEVRLADRFGLYTETLRRGPTPTLHGVPRTPTVHVGKGGRPYGNAFGEHATDQPGPGIAIRELRQYVPGEAAADIDWKSTARLGEPYVRETEGETDRHTALLVDHRERTGRGPEGETPLEYGREVALAMTASAVEAGDPLGLRTIGDDGITDRVVPGSDPETYSRVRSALFGLEPTTESTAGSGRSVRNPEDLSSDLTGGTPFDRTLRPFLADTEPYVRRVRDDPLVDAVRRTRSELGSEAWLVVVTTDDDPARLRESVKLATRGGASLLLFVMPTALFRDGSLGDVDETYDAYVDFEEFRRELDGHPRVTVLELAPGDRLDAVLAAHSDAGHSTEAAR